MRGGLRVIALKNKVDKVDKVDNVDVVDKVDEVDLVDNLLWYIKSPPSPLRPPSPLLPFLRKYYPFLNQGKKALVRLWYSL